MQIKNLVFTIPNWMKHPKNLAEIRRLHRYNDRINSKSGLMTFKVNYSDHF